MYIKTYGGPKWKVLSRSPSYSSKYWYTFYPSTDKHRATPRVLPQASLLPPGKASSTLTVLSSSQGRNLSGAHKATPEFTRHPGYSLHEWKRVCETGGDLAGVGGKLLKVTPEELARHQLESDVWTSVRGWQVLTLVIWPYSTIPTLISHHSIMHMQ